MDQSESTAANLDRRSRRRWFQYSLRSFLVLLTVLGVWLGFIVNRAREQREAVKAIEAKGGVVVYDWQYASPAKIGGPEWLRQLLGDDYFQNARLVSFLTGDSARPSPPEADILMLVKHLTQLRTLHKVNVSATIPENTLDELKAALPNCEVRAISFP